MYLEYFDKFKGQEPYFHIDETEWSYIKETFDKDDVCLLYTSPSPRDATLSRMPSSA